MSKAIKSIMILANDTTYTYNLRKEILASLIQHGYGVTVVSEFLEHKSELEKIGCNMIDMPTERHGVNPVQDICLFLKYISIILREKPFAVLTYNIKPNCYGGMACLLTRTPYFPNITGLGTAVENPGGIQVLAIHLYRLGVKGARTVFFQNEENEKFFQGHNILSDKSDTVLLPGSGVALDRYPVMPYPESCVIHFLYVSRILKEKGIDLFLNAAKYIRRKNPNTAFHICGSCDDNGYKAILEQAEQDGYVLYHGEQREMQPWFSMCSCLVHPSYYPEGMSNVLLEAASSGRPVITTDRSGCKEAVDDGISGYVIPIKSQEALNEALDRFMSLSIAERKAMGLAGRAKMEHEFSRNIVVKSYMNAINGLS